MFSFPALPQLSCSGVTTLNRNKEWRVNLVEEGVLRGIFPFSVRGRGSQTYPLDSDQGHCFRRNQPDKRGVPTLPYQFHTRSQLLPT